MVTPSHRQTPGLLPGKVSDLHSSCYPSKVPIFVYASPTESLNIVRLTSFLPSPYGFLHYVVKYDNFRSTLYITVECSGISYTESHFHTMSKIMERISLLNLPLAPWEEGWQPWEKGSREVWRCSYSQTQRKAKSLVFHLSYRLHTQASLYTQRQPSTKNVRELVPCGPEDFQPSRGTARCWRCSILAARPWHQERNETLCAEKVSRGLLGQQLSGTQLCSSLQGSVWLIRNMEEVWSCIRSLLAYGGDHLSKHRLKKD